MRLCLLQRQVKVTLLTRRLLKMLLRLWAVVEAIQMGVYLRVMAQSFSTQAVLV